MKFFDLHFHPVLKTLFKEQNHALSAWKVIHIPRAYRINGMESQSALDQVSQSGMNLLCMTRHPVEMGMVDQWMLRLASNVYTQFEKIRLNKMANGDDYNDYNSVLNDEWTNLNKTPDGNHPKKIHILSSLSEYKEDEPDILYIFFNLEGGHIFYGKNNNPLNITPQTIKDKFIELKENKLILYLTPTHLTPNVFINHAYGNKILSKRFFLPQSCGVSPLGWELINITYSNNILIDVKHMSLVSRKQFYEHHKKNFPEKPIIASHVGLTGHTWIDVYKRIKRKKIAWLAKVVKIFVEKKQGHLHSSNKIIKQKTEGYLYDTYFNPNSINLYDEEIENILNSGGLIGLNFDIRILGGQRNLSGGIKKFESEFLYIDEYYEWHNTGDSDNKELADRFDDEYAETENDIIWDKDDLAEQIEEMQELFPDVTDTLKYNADEYELLTAGTWQVEEKALEHCSFFINQLLHIVSVSREKNLQVDPWDHICIGSDFDGLIAAIHCCPNMCELQNFANMLRAQLPIAASESGIDLKEDIDIILEKLFFKNAYTLLKKQFP